MFGMWSAELAGLWREGEGDVGVKPCGCPGLSLQEAPARAALQSGIVHAGGLLNDKAKAALGRGGGGESGVHSRERGHAGPTQQPCVCCCGEPLLSRADSGRIQHKLVREQRTVSVHCVSRGWGRGQGEGRSRTDGQELGPVQATGARAAAAEEGPPGWSVCVHRR